MLEVTQLCSGYRPGVDVLHDVSFSHTAGALGFIGRNGAGKSCLAQAISGALASSAGHIRFNGLDIARLSQRKRVRAGISLVPEGRLVFGQLTVLENLTAAAYAAKKGAQQIGRLQEQFPILGRKRHDLAASMSGGEQQALAIARALIQEPSLMILDEPSLGLSPIAVKELAGTLASVIQESRTMIVLMEQNPEFLAALCDRVLLMEQGAVVRSLDVSGEEGHAVLAASYLGV